MFKPVITIKLFNKKGEMTLSRYSTKKQSIMHSLRREDWQTAYIKVTYAPGETNTGEYSNYQQAKEAVDQFTENALLKDYDKY